jgi:hypothetical protein
MTYGSSITMIILYILIYVIVYTLILAKYKKDEILQNWEIERCKPHFLPISGWIKTDQGSTPLKSTLDNFTGCFWQRIKIVFNILIKPFRYIIQLLKNIIRDFTAIIDKIRVQIKIMRNMIFDVVMKMMKKIENIISATIMTFGKLNNMMKRQLAIFQNLQYLLETIAITMSSFVKGTFGTILDHSMGALWALPIFTLGAPGVVFPLMATGAIKNPFCFIPDTFIELYNKTSIKISDINIGDILIDGSRVISKLEFIVPENTIMYDYDGVIVSGSHYVSENNKWITVKDSNISKSINYNSRTLYNICTSNFRININNIQFMDYDEHDDFNEYEIFNNRVLNKINNTCILPGNNNNISYNRRYKLGLGYGTLINGVRIENVKIKGNIIGFIQHEIEKTDRVFLIDGIYILEYTKILKNNIWICAGDYGEAIQVEYPYKYMYHLATIDQIINTDKFLCRDLIECNLE